MVIEMRTYKLKSGCRGRFLEIFRTKSIPAHAEIGMKILGPFLSIDDEDTFFFMRGFPDLQSREPMKAKFYEGELWKLELENLLMPMIEKYEVVLVEDNEGLLTGNKLGSSHPLDIESGLHRNSADRRNVRAGDSRALAGMHDEDSPG